MKSGTLCNHNYWNQVYTIIIKDHDAPNDMHDYSDPHLMHVVMCILMYVYVAPPTPVGAWSMALGLRQRFEYYYYYVYTHIPCIVVIAQPVKALKCKTSVTL